MKFLIDISLFVKLFDYVIIVYLCDFYYRATGGDVLFEDQVYLTSQNGTMLLDKFSHFLLVKCSIEVWPRL